MNGGDLADIGMHYGPAPSAFWVAEVQDSGGGGTIIGCVGLGMSLCISSRLNPEFRDVYRFFN